jgi:hypothetical protein
MARLILKWPDQRFERAGLQSRRNPRKMIAALAAEGMPAVRYCLLATALLFTPGLPPTAHAQGCSQCREAVGETPAATQAAYRRAILVMVAAGATIFAAALVTFRRFR